MKKDLFEDIVELLPECNYISDLRSMIDNHNQNDMIYVFEKISPEDYEVNQWNELYRYLMHSAHIFKNSQEAYDSMLELFKK